MCNEKKDFSLLRPFDLEAAKRGEAVCNVYGDILFFVGINGNEKPVVHEVNKCGLLFTRHKENLYMAPLLWVRTSVEDDTLKPVYRGDTVYTGNSSCNFVVDKEDGGRIFFTNGGWLFVKDVTFTTSKVKRKIKMFGYRNGFDGSIILRDAYIKLQECWARFPQIDTTIEIEE